MNKYLLIIVIAILPLLPLLNNGLPITHDGVDHLARIANFYDSLSEGNLIPRWAENLNWGYGHPILMFLYPFSSYVASLFHFLGFSLADSLKITFALGFVASGLTMFLWAREQFDDNIGFASALLYLFAPYRFVDLYVRGAIGEHMAFIFPPLVLFFMLRFFNSKKVFGSYFYLVGMAVSFALLLLSHNAISIMFLPFFLLYSFYLFYLKKNIKRLLLIFIFFVIGLILSGFFTLPAFLEGRYTLRDVVIGDEYQTRFVENPLSFIYGEWNYGITGEFTVQLGVPHIIGSLLLLIILIRRKIKKETKVLLFILYGTLLFSLLIQLSISNPLYELFTVLKKFQFPWRFLSLSLFATSILAASSLFIFKKENRKWGVVGIFLLVLLTTFTYWNAKGYSRVPDSFYQKVYFGTTDTGESAPIWSIRFMEKLPQSRIEVISGEARIVEVFRSSVKHSYQVEVLSESARFRENTLYFPGWSVHSGDTRPNMEFQDPSNRGLITFELPKGEHDLEIVFGNTKLRTMSEIISIATLIMLILLGVGISLPYVKKKKKH